nr:MAG TPA: hypothetical protein [Caudoviricetes sp.]
MQSSKFRFTSTLRAPQNISDVLINISRFFIDNINLKLCW